MDPSVFYMTMDPLGEEDGGVVNLLLDVMTVTLLRYGRFQRLVTECPFST